MGLFARLTRVWRRTSSPPPRSTGDQDLEVFFTDAEAARARFGELLAAPELEKRIVIVHGVGAIGKTSLLRMYRLNCTREGVPAALVMGEDAAAPPDVMAGWADELAGHGVELGGFRDRLSRYRALQAKVDADVRQASDSQRDAEQALAGAAAKTAVRMAASAVPVAGPLLEGVSGEATDAVLNLLRARLSKSDFEFFRDPTGQLSDAFVADLGEVARGRRMVLMLDTFEQVTGLGEWLGDVIQRLPEQVLTVVAGRVVPAWDRNWPGWLRRAELIELTEMDDDDVESLVRRYYTAIAAGPPDADRVRDVVRFARGLPLAATTAVELWVRHSEPDLEPTGPQAIADLADQLLAGIAPDVRPAFEAAAVLRSFNADSLAALLEQAGGDELYRELRRWPFTRARRDGLAVHDTMRDVMNEALRSRSPERFRQLNHRAAEYYARLLADAPADERQRVTLEWLYHAIRDDEAAGMRDFEQMAEELVRYQWASRLRSLLNDAGGYDLRQDASRLWRRYYEAQLQRLESGESAAEAELRAIAADDAAEPRLRAYALCDLGALLATLERLAEPDGERLATETVHRSLSTHPQLDAKLVSNHITLMNVSNARADWQESLEHIRDAREHYAREDDRYGLVMTDRLEAAVHGLQGDWTGYLDARERSIAILDRLGDVPALKMHVAYFTWPLVFMGRYREAQASSEEALRLAIRLDERELMITIRESIGLAVGMQEAWDEASERFTEALNFYENFHAAGSTGQVRERYIRALLSFRGLVALRAGHPDAAEGDLLRALEIKQRINDTIGTPEIHVWLGRCHEIAQRPDVAEADYRRALELRHVHRSYFQSAALEGLARLRPDEGHAAEAEGLAQRYGYRDVLAALRLDAGHRAWDAERFDAAAVSYRQALVDAMHFNRFLLDEALGGRTPGTVLRPVLTECRDRGAEGRRMLEQLRAVWEDTSEAEELRATERVVRAREPGRGAPQRTVLEQLDAALAG